MSVSFSDRNTYIGATRADDRQFAAPADQVGDEDLDLDAFEQSRPGSPAPTSDPITLVQSLVSKNEVLSTREARVIRHLRQAKRNSGSLRIQKKAKESLYRVRQERHKRTIADLQDKNKKYERHSQACKVTLVKWKSRERQLLERVGEREREIQTMKAQIEGMRQENERVKQAEKARVAELNAQISNLKTVQIGLESEIAQLKTSLSEMTARTEEYEKHAQHVQEKEAQLASVRFTLQTQLEYLVTMTPKS